MSKDATTTETPKAKKIVLAIDLGSQAYKDKLEEAAMNASAKAKRRLTNQQVGRLALDLFLIENGVDPEEATAAEKAEA